MELQSGFVLAVLVGAVLLVGRIGGTEELSMRLYQVALGVIIAFLAFSATNVFVRPADEDEIVNFLQSDSGNADDAADRQTIARTVHLGVGVVTLLFGLGGMARWRVLPLGLTLGGVLLILFGGATGGALDITRLVTSTARGSVEMDAVNLVLVAAGTVALVWYGFQQWEAPAAARPPAEAADGDEPQ